MKAFQLKVMLKDSKPPIWRRVIVPAGITFSQLSMILNTVMGWSGAHLFEFEFYHLELHILEDADDATGFGRYDSLEASTTYIREYLEENDWFTYIYDMGDYWQHRVTVEKVLTDYENNYPQVIKFKGDCPPDDSGGIYGFYEKLDIAADESNPDHEEVQAWLDEQGCPNPYSLEEVNETLKGCFFYIWGKGEKRPQEEIFESMMGGEYGLHATKRDKNKNGQIIRSSAHEAEDSLRRMADLMKAYQEMLEKGGEMTLDETEAAGERERPSLKEIMSDYEKKDILEIAKTKGIQGTSGCNKESLIEKVVLHMTRPEIAELYFACLTDEEIRVFEECAKEKEPCELEEDDELDKLGEAGYLGLTSDLEYLVPAETVKVYEQISGPEFDKKRKKMGFFLVCLRTAGLLYGITPLEVIVKLTQTNPEEAMDEQEVVEMLGKIPPEYRDFVLKDKKVYLNSLWPDDHGLLQEQGDLPFYIPSAEEIRQVEKIGWIIDFDRMGAVRAELVQKIGAGEEAAAFACSQIACCFVAGGSLEDAEEILEACGIAVKGEKKRKPLLDILRKTRNHTRMTTNRGFTFREILEQALERNRKK